MNISRYMLYLLGLFRLHARSLMTMIVCYRKIPKISLGAYIFQRRFLRGLFLEGLIFGGA